MDNTAIIRYLRRLAAARSEVLLYPLRLDDQLVMCSGEQQAQLIENFYRTWTQPDEPLSSISANTLIE